MKTILAAIILVLFYGCTNNNKTPNNTIEDTKYSNNRVIPTSPKNYQTKTFFSLSNFHFLNDTIFIYARFSECGEWGGHEEFIKLYVKESKFYANYFKYSTNCEKMNEYGMLPMTKVKDTVIIVGDIEKEAINEYSHQLLNAKINQDFPGHAGDIFSISNSEKTLNIGIYDDKSVNIENFNNLVIKLLKLKK